MARQAGRRGGGLTSSPSPSGERTRPDCLPPPRNLVYGEGHGISLPPPCVRRGAAPPADPRGHARARPDRADRRQGGSVVLPPGQGAQDATLVGTPAAANLPEWGGGNRRATGRNPIH